LGASDRGFGLARLLTGYLKICNYQPVDRSKNSTAPSRAGYQRGRHVVTKAVQPDPDFNIDELPFSEDRTRAWQQVAEHGPVIRGEHVVVLTSAEAVEFAAKHPQTFSSAKAFVNSLGSPVRLVPVALDPPDHTRFRRLLDPFFSPKRMAEREPELRKQAGELIDAIKQKGECDFVADIAIPFPSQVFLTLLGLPLEDRDRLMQWKDSILDTTDIGNLDATSETKRHGMELFAYLTDHIASRRADQGGDDLLTQLITLREEGGLTDDEILGLCFLFIIAGLDTVTAALGFAFARLASDAALRNELIADPSRIPFFIEEVLRIDSPVPFVPRVIAEDVEVAGHQLKKDSYALIGFGSANHDSLLYDDVNDVHLEKRPPHFAFGRGPHRCLGSHLARLEVRLVIEEWHRRISEYRLADGAEPRVRWPGGTLSLESVPIVVG
jgi:cytochrome P450